MMRWAAKAKDGWHFSKVNRQHRQEVANVAILCGGVIVLPGGCEQMDLVDCEDCQRIADGVHANCGLSRVTS
jgi:hypothetical protein